MARTKKIESAGRGETTRPKSPAKKSRIGLSEIRKQIFASYQKNRPTYIGTLAVAVVIAALVGLFITNRGLFLAGTINGQMLTTPEFYNRLKKADGDQIFETIVRETLIKQEAAKKGISATSDDIDKKIKQIEDSLGGEENLKLALQQNNSSMEELKDQITIQVLAEKILADKLKVTDEDVAKYKKDNAKTISGMSDDDIREAIKSSKLNEVFSSWYDEIKSKANINRYF